MMDFWLTEEMPTLTPTETISSISDPTVQDPSLHRARTSAMHVPDCLGPTVLLGLHCFPCPWHQQCLQASSGLHQRQGARRPAFDRSGYLQPWIWAAPASPWSLRAQYSSATSTLNPGIGNFEPTYCPMNPCRDVVRSRLGPSAFAHAPVPTLTQARSWPGGLNPTAAVSVFVCPAPMPQTFSRTPTERVPLQVRSQSTAGILPTCLQHGVVMPHEPGPHRPMTEPTPQPSARATPLKRTLSSADDGADRTSGSEAQPCQRNSRHRTMETQNISSAPNPTAARSAGSQTSPMAVGRRKYRTQNGR
ncbi:hypothetical protein B0T11DRAFT_27002 [Plectosphaerella cucumerina]|uniref:Uncharacterized protein n=1 Tax=Plectosphaerella cucumerina TaxID=40658 RepID=A0A8K0TT76_9PEZI|nr:hypothetical protein B0T11DRAFT_27002 [Plectosphaerella cucumerina]